jgi:hypothetical protein
MTIETEVITVEEFCWRPGARIYQTDANEFGRWLQDQAPLKAEQLVELCRESGVPGHEHIYRYTDSEAVQIHREDQARGLLNSLRPLVEILGGGFVDVPAYPSIPEVLLSDAERERCEGTHSREVYVPMSRVNSDEIMLEYLADEAKRSAVAWWARFRAYRGTKEFQEVLPIFEAVEKLKAESE